MNDISLLTIVTAAAIDSVNPCAIGVLVFMITFLTSLKGSRKKLFSIGFTYISIVYICYFSAGIGLIKILSQLEFLDVLYKVIGVLVLIGGVLDLKDGITNTKNPLLSIPKSASPKIKKYIKKATVPAAIVLGGLVALFELPCTGGVYIAILGILSRTQFSLQGVAYLALYNFIFVLPLIVILLLAGFGLSSEKVEAWRTKNKRTMRIVIGLSMIGLALLMISDLI